MTMVYSVFVTNIYMFGLMLYMRKNYISTEIRTRAIRSGLRPEHSALDLSAILTWSTLIGKENIQFVEQHKMQAPVKQQKEQ